MKCSFLFLLVLTCHISLAQHKLKVIKANSKRAYIIEDENDRHNWNLSPDAKPDVYTLTKSPKTKWLKFYTDVDSIKIKIKPGGHFDFVVLLNHKDSCFTRIESWPVKSSAGQKPERHDTIPFVLSHDNNIIVKAVLNHTDTLNLIYDSGTTSLLLTNDAIRDKAHSSKNTGERNSLQIGKLGWDSLRIYPVELSGQGSDGRFGWDLFDGKIVELDYDKSIFIVHNRLNKPDKSYSKLPVNYSHTIFYILGELQIKGRKYKNRFLFDTVYQRTAMLDTMLMKEQNYPRDLKVIKKLIMHNGQGKEFPVITVNNERLNLGKFQLYNIPVQLMATGNPARFKVHILGNEVLKRFNTIFDFLNNVVYLKPNGLMGVPYKDAGI